MMFPINDAIDFAHNLANAAAQITLRHFRTPLMADAKGSGAFDPVTRADREAEAAMRTMITSAYPNHGIAGEEQADQNPDAEFVWVLDPIDGTRPYILGLPQWGTLIGLKRQGVPVLGLMDQPFIGERLWSDESAAWYRGPGGGLSRCQTRRGVRLENAFLTASSPDMFDAEDRRRFDHLAARVKMRRFGGDCYAYAMLALGHIDIVAEASLKPFDIAPLIPIIEKAGGVVKTWSNGDAANGGHCVACGNPELLPQILDILADAPATV